MTAKLKIIARAIHIRLKNRENFDDIINSYPNLTYDEIQELKAYFTNVQEA